MTDLVVDASVASKWFREETDSDRARALLRSHRAGDDSFHAPRLLTIEILNAAATRWRFRPPEMLELAEEILGLGLIEAEPHPREIAVWASRGLTAYDATYVALASELGLPLLTEDQEILDIAPLLSRPLAAPNR